SREKRGAIRQHLREVPRLRLQERIERMKKTFEKHWQPHERRLVQDLDRMITARNDIVHGRHVGKYSIDDLYAERVRSEALFEKLFLYLIGCASKAISGAAAITLEDLKRNTHSDDSS